MVGLGEVKIIAGLVSRVPGLLHHGALRVVHSDPFRGSSSGGRGRINYPIVGRIDISVGVRFTFPFILLTSILGGAGGGRLRGSGRTREGEGGMSFIMMENILLGMQKSGKRVQSHLLGIQ